MLSALFNKATSLIHQSWLILLENPRLLMAVILFLWATKRACRHHHQPHPATPLPPPTLHLHCHEVQAISCSQLWEGTVQATEAHSSKEPRSDLTIQLAPPPRHTSTHAWMWPPTQTWGSLTFPSNSHTCALSHKKIQKGVSKGSQLPAQCPLPHKEVWSGLQGEN